MKKIIILGILIIMIVIAVVLAGINFNTKTNYIVENEYEKELADSDNLNIYDLLNDRDNLYFFEASYNDNYEIEKKYINKYDFEGNRILRKDINTNNTFGNIAEIFKTNNGIGEYHLINKDEPNEDEYNMEVQLYNSDFSQINSFIPHDKIKGGIFGFDENNTYLLTSERTIIRVNGEEHDEIAINFNDEINNITSNFFAVVNYTFDNSGFTVGERRQLYYITYKVDYSGNILWYHIDEDEAYVPCICEKDGDIIVKVDAAGSYKYAFIDLKGTEIWSSKKFVDRQFNPLISRKINDKYIVLSYDSNGHLIISVYNEKFSKQLVNKVIDNYSVTSCSIDDNGTIYALMKDGKTKKYYLNKYNVKENVK